MYPVSLQLELPNVSRQLELREADAPTRKRRQNDDEGWKARVRAACELYARAPEVAPEFHRRAAAARGGR